MSWSSGRRVSRTARNSRCRSRPSKSRRRGFQRPHLLDGAVDVVDDQAFGQFELQLGGGSAGAFQRATHLVDEIGLPELAGADVDGEAQLAGARVVRPVLEPRTGGFQHPLADRQNQSGFLGQRDELGRRNQAALGMAPAQQRLGADDAAGAVDLRLVIENELAIANGESQSGFQIRPRGERALHLGVEEAQRVAPRQFRLVHRDVGLLEQFVERVAGVDEQRDADARSAVMQAPGDGVGLVERRQNPFADLLGLARPASADARPILRAGRRTRRRRGGRPCRLRAAQPPIRRATSTNRRSPTSWPAVSLRILKLSRPMNSSAPFRPLRAQPASACCRRSRNRRRLGNWVRES